MKLCITYIVTDKYHVFFDTFYSSCKKYFCTEDDISYFIFTDDAEKYKSRLGKDIDLDCMIFPIYPCSDSAAYNKFHKFNYIIRSEELYRNFDYVFYMNGNLTCRKPVHVDELFNGKQQYAVTHSLWDRVRNPMYNSLTKQTKSAAYFDTNKYTNWRYFQSGNFGCTTQKFIDMCNYIECSRCFDAYYKLDKYIPWHDETYYNKYINLLIHKNDSINILDGKKYLCTDFQPLQKYVNDCKMFLLDKSSVWNNKH